MNRHLALAACAVLFAAVPLQAAGLTGLYVEARTCDVWTGPCFANAEINWGGKHAVLGWKIEKGEFEGVKLDGLSVVAVLGATDTLGNKQTGEAKAVLILDENANRQQGKALIALAKKQLAEIATVKVVSTDFAPVNFQLCDCAEGGCAILKAGNARIETKCLDAKAHKICGNESEFFPPLLKSVKATAALAVENSYAGDGVGETWKDVNRRGAYLGTFEIK